MRLSPHGNQPPDTTNSETMLEGKEAGAKQNRPDESGRFWLINNESSGSQAVAGSRGAGPSRPLTLLPGSAQRDSERSVDGRVVYGQTARARSFRRRSERYVKCASAAVGRHAASARIRLRKVTGGDRAKGQRRAQVVLEHRLLGRAGCPHR